MVYHYTLLCAIIHYYCTIIRYYYNYCNYWNYLTIIRGWCERFWAKQTSGMGNTPRVSCWRRIPAAWSPRSVIDMDLWFLGSRTSTHAVNRFQLAAIFHQWPKRCQLLRFIRNWNIRTTLCIATDGSVAWMCTHHGLFHNLNEKQPKCQNDDCEIDCEMQCGRIAAHCTLTKNVRHAHARCETFLMRIN